MKNRGTGQQRKWPSNDNGQWWWLLMIICESSLHLLNGCRTFRLPAHGLEPFPRWGLSDQCRLFQIFFFKHVCLFITDAHDTLGVFDDNCFTQIYLLL